MDAAGGFQGWGGWVGFCSSPSPPGSPEKLTEQADSSQLPSSSPRLAGTARQMLELQQGVQMIPARHSHAVGRSHNTSGSHTHTHTAQTWGPRAPHTHTHNTRSSGSQRWRRTQQSFFFVIKDEHKRFPLNYACL